MDAAIVHRTSYTDAAATAVVLKTKPVESLFGKVTQRIRHRSGAQSAKAPANIEFMVLQTKIVNCLV